MDVNPKSKIFKVQKPNESNNNSKSFYYNCSKCPFHTSYTYNYKRHLSEIHPNELKNFYESAYDCQNTFTSYPHEETIDSSSKKDNNTNQENNVT